GILLEAADLSIQATGTAVSARGGSGRTSNGGTIKLFYGTFSGTAPTQAGRVYDAGAGSF
ncbi:MAG: hypothetical protein KC586_12335, partial [Myxococcales bacterium]|nr:hypothetical protein [Myxococcales bacterium]